MTSKKPKIIVVGGGISGSMAALSALARGASVSIFTILPACRSRSAAIGEGFNAALNTKGEGDNPELHAKDTLSAGEFLAHDGPVQRMCQAAPSLAHFFDRMGVMFERTSGGLMELARSTGSSKRRTAAAAGLSTGRQIACALDGKIRNLALKERLRLFDGWEFLSLILDNEGRCRGICAGNLRNSEIKAFSSSAVIICAGGCEGVFGARSAAPSITGTALTACYTQGAILANPEFTAIHPFTIAACDKCRPISDLLIGMGARVSSEKDTIDISNIDPNWLRRNFSGMMDFYAQLGRADPIETPMKVAPAAYKSLGGLWVRENHATSLPGLFACGSASCLYHGASMQAGNEILSSAHGGDVAGSSAADYCNEDDSMREDAPQSLQDASREREENLNSAIASQEGDENARIIKRELEEELARACLFEKDNAEIGQTREKIAELKERFSKARPLDASQWENAELPLMRRLKLEFELAEAIAAASISRDESRGAHMKPAFPKRDDKKFAAITKVSWSPNGPRIDYSERGGNTLK